MVKPRPTAAAGAGRWRPTPRFGRSVLGAAVTAALYSTVQEVLRSEAAVRRGQISRLEQQKQILAAVRHAVREGVMTSVMGSVLLLLCPWLAGPLAVLGVVGVGHSSLALLNTWWQGLDPHQQRQLHRLAYGGGEALGRRFAALVTP